MKPKETALLVRNSGIESNQTRKSWPPSRWAWMAGSAAAGVIAPAEVDAKTVQISLFNNLFSSTQDLLSDDLTGDGIDDVTLTGGLFGNKYTNELSYAFSYIVRVYMASGTAAPRRLGSAAYAYYLYFGDPSPIRAFSCAIGPFSGTDYDIGQEPVSQAGLIEISFTDSRINNGNRTDGWLEVRAFNSSIDDHTVQLVRLVFDDATTARPSGVEAGGPDYPYFFDFGIVDREADLFATVEIAKAQTNPESPERPTRFDGYSWKARSGIIALEGGRVFKISDIPYKTPCTSGPPTVSAWGRSGQKSAYAHAVANFCKGPLDDGFMTSGHASLKHEFGAATVYTVRLDSNNVIPVGETIPVRLHTRGLVRFLTSNNTIPSGSVLVNAWAEIYEPGAGDHIRIRGVEVQSIVSQDGVSEGWNLPAGYVPPGPPLSPPPLPSFDDPGFDLEIRLKPDVDYEITLVADVNIITEFSGDGTDTTIDASAWIDPDVVVDPTSPHFDKITVVEEYFEEVVDVEDLTDVNAVLKKALRSKIRKLKKKIKAAKRKGKKKKAKRLSKKLKNLKRKLRRL